MLNRTLSFIGNKNAQDMVRIAMDQEKTTAENAVVSVINMERFKDVMENPEPIIGLGLWGHADTHRRRKLRHPVVDIQVTAEQNNMIENVMEKEACDVETAVSYFLTSAMGAYGYHI